MAAPAQSRPLEAPVSRPQPRAASIAARVARWTALTSLVDAALVGCGVALAASSFVFAVVMLNEGDHAPRVNGMQYLAIFAKPLHSPRPAVAAASAPAETAIDMAPVGSIARAAPADSPDGPSYRLVAVEDGRAWLGRGSEMRIVRPGDIVPGLGRVAAIVKREGRWALVDETGETLLTTDPATPKELSQPGSPFARPMIFGDGA